MVLVVPENLPALDPAAHDTVDDAAETYRKWHPSCGMDANDALLAATVAATGGKLYTLNVRHYPMTDIVAVKGW
ncbi:MAG: hypothetical protein HY713_07685 [candidate division NC10 bacterium]|nr:hypothetical protein [candidate division NC10 bacterium]